MPRPGPRPYECVRRAWHSDRHQPMRGSLIQEIFRMANDLHSPSTRKNKEWQEKLPYVVFKAEEIMYSKANSEAEYMDLKTLQDRANDAIDTIIRRDDNPESGLLLQPCIEAALNLGCVPRRASRSQRHSNPGHYLSSVTKDVSAAPLNVLDINRTILGHGSQPAPSDPTNLQNSSSQSVSWCTALFNSENGVPSIEQVKSIDSGTSQSKDTPAVTNYGFNFTSKPHFLSFQGSESVQMETCASSACRMSPLFYSENQPEEVGSCKSSQNFHDTRNTIGAAPYFQSLGLIDASLPVLVGSKTGTGSVEEDSVSMGKVEELSDDRCDLSLRLGLPSPRPFGGEHSWTCSHEDFRPRSSFIGNKLYDPSSAADSAAYNSNWTSEDARPFYIEACHKGPLES